MKTLNSLVFDLSKDKSEEDLIRDKTDLILENEKLKQELDELRFERTGQKQEDLSKSVEEAFQHISKSFEIETDDIPSLKTKVEQLEKQLQGYWDGWKSDSFEMFSSNSAAHVKDVLLKYLWNTPLSEPWNEALLEVVFSILHITDSEKQEIWHARELKTPILNVENPKSNWTSPGRGQIKKRNFIESLFAKKEK